MLAVGVLAAAAALVLGLRFSVVTLVLLTLATVINFATSVLGGSGPLVVGLQMLATLASVQISYIVGCLLAAHLPVRAELPLRSHAHALRCIQATHFRKDRKLQFWSLCDHFRSERSGVGRLVLA